MVTINHKLTITAISQPPPLISQFFHTSLLWGSTLLTAELLWIGFILAKKFGKFTVHW